MYKLMHCVRGYKHCPGIIMNLISCSVYESYIILL